MGMRENLQSLGSQWGSHLTVHPLRNIDVLENQSKYENRKVIFPIIHGIRRLAHAVPRHGNGGPRCEKARSQKRGGRRVVNARYHFVDTTKVIEAGKGAKLERADCSHARLRGTLVMNTRLLIALGCLLGIVL